ncbi:short chain dehydrogenase [Heliocybe sulcata]|uniref:Short chain dehydrogenase n=1 Tax=Heliocybe sulcata TaxID=5364 RepID=A0A5C3MTD0_9AGAM|nr:short chain dehydrogenase [Heliocybe sulcata]
MSKQLVWLVTGTSSGIGREIVLAALDRGDHVIATTRGRSFDALAALKEKGAAILELDVTAPMEKLDAIAAEAVKIYGRVDVLVNNAGDRSYEAPQDLRPEDTLQQFNTNLFGPLNVTRAFLPYMRERRTGTVAWIGSVGGYSFIPLCGLYCATKAAMIRVSEALNVELQPFNVRSICFDFGWFNTELAHPDRLAPLTQRIPDYKQKAEDWNSLTRSAHFHYVSHGSRLTRASLLPEYYQNLPGDPVKAGKLLVQVIRGEGVASGKAVPSRFAVGADAYGVIKDDAVTSAERLEAWRDVSASTDVEKAAVAI